MIRGTFMKRILSDLWESDVENPAPGLTTHAYLLIREPGNVLFYNTGHRHELDAMAELGGVAFQYLSHRDELGESLNRIHRRFGTRLGGHVSEGVEFARVRAPDILFTGRAVLPGDVEVLPTPGHSPGSVCFLVRGVEGRRYLFTGDTLYLNNGAFRPGFIDGLSDRDALARSLDSLRAIEPDVVLSSAFGGKAGFREIASPEEWTQGVDRALHALQA